MKIPKTMRAAVYRGPNNVQIETVPVPRIKRGELLVKVAACGICPTDIKKIQHGMVPPPRIFGHETAGVVVKTGGGVDAFKPGDRVALHHHVPCLRCPACQHRAFAQCPLYKRTGITAGFEPAGGGFAEFVRVMSLVMPGVVKIPARNSFLEGAMLEPVNTILKGIKRLSLLRDDTVLVAGQGPVGLIFTRLLALQGIRVIATDLLTKRLKLALQLGAAQACHAHDLRLTQKIRRLTRGWGLDAAVIAVPSDAAIQHAAATLRGGGQILLFAHTRRGTSILVDLSTICVDEKDLLGSYSADFTLQKQVARLVFSRSLDVRPLISHQFPLERAAEAISLAANPTADSLKVFLLPNPL